MIASVKTGKKSDRHWTPEQDQHLLDLVDAEATLPLIAITLGRSVQPSKSERKNSVAPWSISG
jgi:hypothetical protein